MWRFRDMAPSETLMPDLRDRDAESAPARRRLLASLSRVEPEGGVPDALQAEPADLHVGKTRAQEKTMTESATLSFGFLSGDFNPLHFNDALAQRTRFMGRIVHGFHTASLFSGVLAELCPWCVYLRQEMEFVAPVRTGDRITAIGVIEEINDRGLITVKLECRNQRDEVVVRGKAILKKLKEVYQQVER
jgi:3-hydroxybutyryl-CoA dehydratase